jgi:hypothetical protein
MQHLVADGSLVAIAQRHQRTFAPPHLERESPRADDRARFVIDVAPHFVLIAFERAADASRVLHIDAAQQERAVEFALDRHDVVDARDVAPLRALLHSPRAHFGERAALQRRR